LVLGLIVHGVNPLQSWMAQEDEHRADEHHLAD
jgi:hypothetical protein